MNPINEKNKTIMVIDDSPFVSTQISDIVEDKGYHVLESVKTGELGVAKYKELSPDFVILDMVLPGMDGIQTARQLLDIDSSAKILMLSSLNDISFIDDVRSLGIRFVLTKPVKKGELLQSLGKMGGIY